jgi:preprotein translocase subunit SecA
VFFLSLEDDLMRIFGSERMDSMLSKLGLKEDEAIIHPWINKALEKAQQKVEARNYEIRKNLLKFDDVMNDQRKVVYEQRKDLMRVEDVSATVLDMRHEVIEDIVDDNIPEKAYAEEWDTEGLTEDSQRLLGLELPITEWAAEEGIADEEIRERITEASDRQMAAKVAKYGAEIWRMAEKSLLLQILDQTWKDHLLTLDHLRQGIGLRAYAQRDPLNEYKQEAFSMFESMLSGLREQVTQLLTHIELRLNEAEQEAPDERPPQETVETRQDPAFAGIAPADRERAEALPPPPAMSEEEITAAEAKLGTLRHAEFDEDDPTTWSRTGRNAPCPCGSGKKYKQCHGKLA